MKANLSEPVNIFQSKGNGPFGGYELRLTVGMIVKNEEKTLEKCLRSIRPLLDAVPSELIITDTGSTDRTVEIAEQYADKIIHFEWCDDFSAARNTGLEAADGEWFLFLDGDEWFQDTTELIDFFNSGDCDQYGSGSYIQRNYTSFERKTYTDFHASRIFRRYPGMKFVGIIHENIPRIEPCKYLNSYVHHYGYIHTSNESLMDKFHRNADLLIKQLENSPNNLKSYFQLTQEYMIIKKYNDAICTAEKGLEVEKSHPDIVWHSTILHHLVKTHFITNNYQDVIDACNAYIDSSNYKQIPYIDCYYLEQLAATHLNQTELAVECGQKYLELYELYHKDKLNKSPLLAMGYDYLEKNHCDEVLRLTAENHIKLDNKKNTLSCLNQLDLMLPDSMIRTYSIYTSACEHFNDWSILSQFYKGVLELSNNDKFSVFVTCTEGYIGAHQDNTTAVLHSIVDVDVENNYSLLCKLRLMEQDGNHESAKQLLKQLAQCSEELNSYYSDILYYAMIEQTDFSSSLQQFDTDDLPTIVAYIGKQHNDFTDVINSYLETAAAETPKELYWLLCLLERLILTEAETKNDDNCAELLEQYAALGGEYLNSVYRSDFLEKNSSALPRVCRFMYWLSRAFLAKQNSDNAAYLSSLRSALKAYPVMNDPVQILLERFEEEQQEQQSNADEFAMLAQKMKNQVNMLIEQGHLIEAGELTQQLAQLLPNDKDIQRFQLLTSVKPTMQDMISDLMQ